MALKKYLESLIKRLEAEAARKEKFLSASNEGTTMYAYREGEYDTLAQELAIARKELGRLEY